MTNRANITISREGSKISSLSVAVPVWMKWNDRENLLSIQLPLFGLETVAKNEKDVVNAIEEAIISFCIITEKFGRGAEKELEALGWKTIDDGTIKYDISESDFLLERMFGTGDNYVNQHLKMRAA